MKKEIKKVKPVTKKSSSKGSDTIPPYPVNPESEDIYRNSIEEQDVDPEDTTKTKRRNEAERIVNEDPDDFDADVPSKEPIRKKKIGKKKITQVIFLPQKLEVEKG